MLKLMIHTSFLWFRIQCFVQTFCTTARSSLSIVSYYFLSTEIHFYSNGFNFFRTDAPLGKILDQLRRQSVLEAYTNNELPLLFQGSAFCAVSFSNKISHDERSNVLDVLAKDVNGSWRYKNDRYSRLVIEENEEFKTYVRRYYTCAQSEAKRVIAYFVEAEGKVTVCYTLCSTRRSTPS